ncbi:hypothetical protein ABE484_10265 [Pseudomonas pudica]|uniref:hypothetical protein n=1 Tax=Pseudomonas TaxID=286 RepID=UPI000A1F2E3F|nr:MULTISPECIES: hypothetical protein [Pseudomonas]GLO39651.1 hypothetical protein PPUN15366_12950 [Pseudomonas putida]HDS0975352.1 hypothetical protein [Pseudomonas putida]
MNDLLSLPAWTEQNFFAHLYRLDEGLKKPLAIFYEPTPYDITFELIDHAKKINFRKNRGETELLSFKPLDGGLFQLRHYRCGHGYILKDSRLIPWHNEKKASIGLQPLEIDDSTIRCQLTNDEKLPFLWTQKEARVWKFEEGPFHGARHEGLNFEADFLSTREGEPVEFLIQRFSD